ncbi:hypothetical protein CMP1-41 [Clavibacter phage CMP1]|uniref:Uncharacterized protein n=1 Tax=Clavibacter phage CMP1 TaxID=686439 RepID=D0U225_9CAUD|nr:hypothetical protein CMP1-41 [Clavibacter phage CMP1]ACY35937.1 hypothetical protein CMP1-41 [Clavibacter phage CMP1]
MAHFPADPTFDGKRLPIYWATDDHDLSRIKAAKLALAIPYTVYPSAASASTDGRILAVGGHPPFLCDYALVSPSSGPEGVQAALSWVLGDHEDPRATLLIDTLRHVFGPAVRELTAEELAAEERLRAYQQRDD